MGLEMKITKDEVLHVADLARLDLDEASIDKFAGQIANILEYIAKQGGKIQRHRLIGSKTLDGGSKEYDEILTTLEQSGKITIHAGEEKKREEYIICKEL